MIEILRVTDSTIELSGISFRDGEMVDKIMEICHKFKHLYLEGYPCGRKTRKKSTEKYKKWTESPGICFTYTVTNDNENHNLIIHVFVSDMETLLKKYTEREINYYTQMYTQEIADGIATM